MTVIKDLETTKKFFSQLKTPIFGVGVYAFNRLGLEEVASNYRILALRYSLDTKPIEKDIEVLSLEKGMGTKHIKEPRNATTVVAHPRIKKHLSQFAKPALVVYKTSQKMERICQQNNWQLWANPKRFGKQLFENKIKFRKILKEIGIPPPPGEITPLKKLHYRQLKNKYGLPFVIQHPTRGGGKGTFFIKNKEIYDQTILKLQEKIDEEDIKTTPPKEVIVSRFITGPSPSITACVFKKGVVSTSPQYQLLDIPQLYNPQKGSGLFCGHDWTSSRFNQKVLNQAYQATEKIGEYFKKYGYCGIFGLDFILNEKTNKLYTVECNPRQIASSPVLGMAQALNSEVPIIACHALSFLEKDSSFNLQIDIDSLNSLIRQEKIGSQMFLHNLSGRWAKNHRQAKAGVYRLRKASIKYLRPGYKLKHLKNNEEFLLADGVPLRKSHFSPNRRLCRILTLNKTKKGLGQLTPWATETSEAVYRAFDIRPVRFIKIKKIFFPNLLAKG